MNNIDKIKELVKEAKELVEEFSNESCSIGEPTVTEVHISEDGLSLIVELNFYNTEMEYGITEVSSIFAEEMEGFGPCPAGFYEGFELAVNEIDSQFNSMNKKEFVEYVGELYYAKYRCEAIYKRLEAIEREAVKLIKQ